ncbi:alpha/beta hydrolase [Syntrophorhabdus aromaticivorans]|uniref:Alpha/beta fold hydrolase n=1 Tax=Syntrophorhabdus aromaticivorans TaxID=328301 RepID=A0A971M3W8_9BACT|nr:alpha/beta fold hydrolase [Syntrophorhabdus aromaticivorans]NLW35533.1 alpha/beta fold hydrolase [Syntrophorhabdus aromaticivorans]
MIRNFKLASTYNTIQGIMVIPGINRKYPCVILSHGLVSSKESSKYAAVSEKLAENGIATCRFDYHGCGQSSGKIEETTLTIRLDNLDAVTEYVLGHSSIDPERIGIMGSSFGGVTCVLKAAKDSRIRCISPWATPHRLEKEGDGAISDIHFHDAIFTDFARYDILSEARKVSSALVIHGELDEVVPCEEGKAIYGSMKEPKECVIIEGGDHVLSDPSHREKAIGLALNWFQKYL